MSYNEEPGKKEKAEAASEHYHSLVIKIAYNLKDKK